MFDYVARANRSSRQPAAKPDGTLLRMVAQNFFPSSLRCLGIKLLFLCVLSVAASSGSNATAAQEHNGTATILAAGDIGNCKKSAIKQIVNWWYGEERHFGGHMTARLLERLSGTILVLGDLVYRFGRQLDVSKCFEPSWGRFRDRIAPAPGNHDFDTATGLEDGWGYYDYWGAKAGYRGRGYYSFVRGTWHIVALNSTLDPAGRRAQENWLRADLAATGTRCILAFWHHPVFSSGHHGNSDKMAGAYRILFDAGASVVLTGHEHSYERLAPLAPDGSTDRVRGLRNFIVGTGGHKLRTRDYSPHPGSEIFDSTSWGVLKMGLFDGHYTWQFVPVDGHKFTDRGSGRCVVRRGLRKARLILQGDE